MIIFNVHICNIVIIGMIANIINCHFYLRLWSLFTNGILVEKCSSASTRERESGHFTIFISIPSNQELVEVTSKDSFRLFDKTLKYDSLWLLNANRQKCTNKKNIYMNTDLWCDGWSLPWRMVRWSSSRDIVPAQSFWGSPSPGSLMVDNTT